MSNLLNWPHWVVDLVEENDYDYRVSAHLLHPPPACTFCGSVGELRPYGVREQRFMDLPIRAKRVGILVGRRRFKCHSCGRTFIEPLADMDETHRYTEALNGSKLIHRLGRGYSFEAVRAMLYSEGLHMKRKPTYRERAS